MLVHVAKLLPVSDSVSVCWGCHVYKCYMQVIDLILLYDGDVMKFAGDSMIVAFSPGRDEKTDEDGGLKAATVRCLHCATHLVDKYGMSYLSDAQQ